MSAERETIDRKFIEKFGVTRLNADGTKLDRKAFQKPAEEEAAAVIKDIRTILSGTDQAQVLVTSYEVARLVTEEMTEDETLRIRVLVRS